MMNAFKRLTHLYTKQINKRPLITQALTAGTMTTISDIVTQQLVERKETIDLRRTAIMGSCGFFYFGPLVGAWLSILNKSKLPVFACVALDQGIFAATILSGFLGIQSVLSGKSISAARERVKNDLFSVMKVNWMIWIPAQTLNFYVVPFQFRMVFMQVVAFFWNCYLSNKANSEQNID